MYFLDEDSLLLGIQEAGVPERTRLSPCIWFWVTEMKQGLQYIVMHSIYFGRYFGRFF